SFPRYSELPIAKIRDIKSNGDYYVLDAKILQAPKYVKSAEPDALPEDEYFLEAIIQDNTGQIPLILPPRYPRSDLMPVTRIKVIGKAFYVGEGGPYWLIPPPNIEIDTLE